MRILMKCDLLFESPPGYRQPCNFTSCRVFLFGIAHTENSSPISVFLYEFRIDRLFAVRTTLNRIFLGVVVRHFNRFTIFAYPATLAIHYSPYISTRSDFQIFGPVFTLHDRHCDEISALSRRVESAFKVLFLNRI